MEIRSATSDDFPAIDAVILDAFGQVAEAHLCDILRRDQQLVCELVAVQDTMVVGHIVLSQFLAPDRWLVLAPLAVAPAHHRSGIGGALIKEAKQRATHLGWDAIVVLGAPALYERFGFSVTNAANLITPYPSEYTALCWLKIDRGAVAAKLMYPDAFSQMEE
ncbi:MAG: N-acetyltransferase [Pseudoruegeria sp.]